ncbi:glycoside hydrolase family 13 protein [Prochlorococcus sp. MIT 1307]|uniref:glycoside hydrolase family 13 protein n=1 Tax=Prochlorococcus sp. MIT 1307 TaxID=3096219 RepID=UPI002A74BF80|nr:glycoside hydrolase family 13 protein [Prochlorococcus sp. MIT 1307]
MQHKNLFCKPPGWVSDAIAYQIFPDRFRRSGHVGVDQGWDLQAWGGVPSHEGFYGGDLYGVIDALDYLQQLGINCLYLNPVFSSAANHRYHTFDYFQVDPLLGGGLALEALISALHSRGMRIILDGVFNHCGRGFWAFHHLLENGYTSPYRDWFHVHNWPLLPYPQPGQDCGYSCWWNDPALPKFNHKHFPVREYLISVAVYWIERGIDGWRLDVPDEVPIEFWVDFRNKVKAINPDAWIVGEIWGDARKWLKGDHFDGVMNYRIGWSSVCWSAKNKLRTSYKNPSYPLKLISGAAFIDILQTTLGWYSNEVNNSQLNLLDSHDVPRALNTLKGDISALKIALFLLFLQPGVPCIYYGTEVGLSGGEEPACRECFPWYESWNVDLRSFILSLVALRKNIFEVFNGELEWKTVGEDGLLAVFLQKELDASEVKSSIEIFVNRSRSSWMPIQASGSEYFFLEGEVDGQGKRLAPQSFVLFKEAI